MREIHVAAGTATVLSRVRILSIRLKARPDTLPLAAEVDAARADLKRWFDLWEEQHDAALAATGAIAFADGEEDDVIADVARRAKVLVDGQIRSPIYVRLFAEAPSLLTRGVADEAQAELAEHVANTIETNTDYTSLRDLLPSLKEARKAVVQAQTDRTTLERAESVSWNEIQIAEKRARDVYRDTHPKLQILFPGRKRLVESFFYKEQPKRKRGAGEESWDGGVEPTGTE